MRCLFTIPHYYDGARKGSYGSVSAERAVRAASLKAAIQAILSAFGGRQGAIDLPSRRIRPANHGAGSLIADVVICTTGHKHLVEDLDLLSLENVRHEQTRAKPMLLGYECHRVQREALGSYDWFVFLEDDLVFHDPHCVLKCQWFSSLAGADAVLFPNRYELSAAGPVRKLYIDANLGVSATAPFQCLKNSPVLKGTVMGRNLRFNRARNPHSGCYLLSAEQLEHWSLQPYFLDFSTEFFTGLESAATLGIMRTFRIYKPAYENADFLEVEHSSPRYLNTRLVIDDELNWVRTMND